MTLRLSASNLRAPAVLSAILILPLVVLEMASGPENTAGPRYLLDTSLLVGLLWILPFAFFVLLKPVTRHDEIRTGVKANLAAMLFRVALLALIAVMWIGIVVDQLPCFLGVPNCD